MNARMNRRIDECMHKPTKACMNEYVKNVLVKLLVPSLPATEGMTALYSLSLLSDCAHCPENAFKGSFVFGKLMSFSFGKVASLKHPK